MGHPCGEQHRQGLEGLRTVFEGGPRMVEERHTAPVAGHHTGEVHRTVLVAGHRRGEVHCMVLGGEGLRKAVEHRMVLGEEATWTLFVWLEIKAH